MGSLEKAFFDFNELIEFVVFGCFLSFHSLLILIEEFVELSESTLKLVLSTDYLGFFLQLDLFFQRVKPLDLIRVKTPHKSDLYLEFRENCASLLVQSF